ncbi:MAG: lysine--tRNA ligase, partial [Alphaproteobacteria bacterium]|nr:lysine--tRNA ligase [Alphaproteobacteria bacterium]
TDGERAALEDLARTLEGFRAVPAAALDSEKIQFEVYEVGKRHGFAADLKAWFAGLYEILLGTQQGPRMGAFIAISGVAETIALIGRALAGEDLGKAA